MATRISNGVYKNRVITTDGNARPTEARVREALFSSIAETLEGASFADLFAGSGTVGIEALSRGAQFALFVEDSTARVKGIAEVVRKLGIAQGNYQIQKARLPTKGPLCSRTFDFVFLDPPYEFAGSLELAQKSKYLLHPESLLIYEHPARSILDLSQAGLILLKTRKFGDTALSFFRHRC